MTHALTVADVMTSDVITVAEDTPYKSVVSLMAEHHISAVPVVDRNGGLAGVVSETDLLRKEEFRHSRRPLWAMGWWRRGDRSKAAGLRAADVMSHPAVTIEPAATIPAAARSMAARTITRLIVTNGDRLVGIVTRSDLLKAFLVPDDRIREQVRRDVLERALWVGRSGAEIAVQDGVVTLTGEVDHRSAADVAGKLTGEVDGVVGVDNRLTWVYDDTEVTPVVTPSPEVRRRP
jgi:CBS domain-containing protein